MAGLLYPAYQKWYSALSALDRFNREASFFNNASCLDVFFSEYRNITFVMQKSLKGTQYWDYYVKNVNKYLVDHWFIDKRNETIKEAPVDINKTLRITIYFSNAEVPFFEKTFSVDNDAPLAMLLQEIKKCFLQMNTSEVFFSVKYSFRDKKDNVDLLERIQQGLSSMNQFMIAMDEDIGEKCAVCDDLKEEIKKIKIQYMPQGFVYVDDYVYYPQSDTFDRANRWELHRGNSQKAIEHAPIQGLVRSVFKYDGSVFGSFTLMHSTIKRFQPNAEIMPAIMLVYGDGTYDLETFQSSLKTTFYRKINEAAKTIQKTNVVEICFMTVYAIIPNADNMISKTAIERLSFSNRDCMICASVNEKLEEKEFFFDGDLMRQKGYALSVMNKGPSKKLVYSKNNLTPIVRAFLDKANNAEG